MNLKEDFVAIMLYIISALIIGASGFFYFVTTLDLPEKLKSLYNMMFAFGIVPVLLISIFLIAIGRVIDLLNQINQKIGR